MQRNLPALDRSSKANVAKPDFRERHQISSDDDIDISGGCLEANLDIVGSHNKPPVARAAITLGYTSEIEANNEPLHRYFRGIDLPAHAPEKHLGIEIVRPDQSL